MELSAHISEEFNENGYLFLENLFNRHETEVMLKEMHRLIEQDCPERILEKNGRVRSFFAPETRSRIFYEVVHSSRLISLASFLIGNDVYVHQTKINSKFAMYGDWWEWHQDYTFWKLEDGMPAPTVLTAMIYLNDVNEFNGPLLLIPGSHREGTKEIAKKDEIPETESLWFNAYKSSTPYMSALTADLRYTLDQSTIAAAVKRNGLFSAKGPAGSVLFFHGNLFHASYNNLSPWDRHAFLITYNSIDNRLMPLENPRPEFIACRNFDTIEPVVSEIFK